MFDDDLLKRAETTLATARARGLKIAVAESCTGGLLAGVFTEIAGSSDVFERGFVTYSNEAKQQMLGVPAETIMAHGAVSAETAKAMAEGALSHSLADITASVTGVAGPGGGSEAKPVGHVQFGAARRGHPTELALHRFGDLGRGPIRLAAVRVALDMIDRQLARA
jgi:nicotinamide-nucleotide amidase